MDWYRTKSYSLKEAGEDLASIVTDNCIIAGPFSSALTINNNIKSFVYMFGLARIEQNLFDKYSITHLAADISNWEEALNDFPILKSSQIVSHYLVRDIELSVIRLSDSKAGMRNAYSLSNLERAVRFYGPGGIPDSVYYYLVRFLNAYPDSKSGLELLSNYYLAQGMTDKGLRLLDKMITRYPHDFSMYLKKAQTYYVLYLMTGDTKYQTQSDRYFEIAKSLNRFIEFDINEFKKYAKDRRRKP